MTGPPPRILCLWYPDWPVVALRRAERVPADGPVVVMGEGGRVRAASAEARHEGVRQGLRKREAQARCPAATVVAADPGLEVRAFEEVARALDAVTHRLALDRPGLLSIPLRGPTRVFGGEEVVAAAVRDAVPGAQIGMASGHFAAALAARQALALAPDATAEFLAARPVRVLRHRGLGDLADLFVRLGIHTLGAVAALPEASVASRFGVEGLRAHRLARGLDEGGAGFAAPPPESIETAELDPPVDRVDTALFAARALAGRLLERLDEQGLALLAVTVEAETEHGEHMARLWRLAAGAGPAAEAALVQRVRWQLEAWVGSLTSGLTLLRLVPEEVGPAPALQLDFFGGDARAADRAAKVLGRLQGSLGHEAVAQPVLRGGRLPSEQGRWIPLGDPVPPIGEAGLPWPGSIPPPAPAVACDPPLPATLVDGDGRPVLVTERGDLRAPPARFACPSLGITDAPIEGWAGPWPQDVRFWDPEAHRRRALFQVVAGQMACLVSISRGEAAVAAVYD